MSRDCALTNGLVADLIREKRTIQAADGIPAAARLCMMCRSQIGCTVGGLVWDRGGGGV